MSKKYFQKNPLDFQSTVNIIIPTVIKYFKETVIMKDIVEECDDIEDYNLFNSSYNFLLKYYDYLIYVQKIKIPEQTEFKLNNNYTLLLLYNYYKLFAPYKDKEIYWNKNNLNKNFLLNRIIIYLARYIFDYKN